LPHHQTDPGILISRRFLAASLPAGGVARFALS
jgi:hypothetical protein